MNRVRMTIIWSLSIVFFVSCESAGDKRLDFALEQAGKNRIELEKVLNYYQNDSLKLEAARFLIRNILQFSQKRALLFIKGISDAYFGDLK